MTETATIWRRLDEQQATLSSVSERQAVTESRLMAMEDRQDRNHNEYMRMLTDQATRQEMMMKEIHTSAGGIKLGKWLATIAAGVSGAAVAVWIYVSKGGH